MITYMNENMRKGNDYTSFWFKMRLRTPSKFVELKYKSHNDI